jgi:hypothetical protein
MVGTIREQALVIGTYFTRFFFNSLTNWCFTSSSIFLPMEESTSHFHYAFYVVKLQSSMHFIDGMQFVLDFVVIFFHILLPKLCATLVFLFMF